MTSNSMASRKQIRIFDGKISTAATATWLFESGIEPNIEDSIPEPVESLYHTYGAATANAAI